MSERRAPQIPAQAQPILGLTQSPDAVSWETFDGIDTKSPRAFIDDRRMQWCHGFMPIGPSNLAILPGPGPAVYTASTTIVWHQYGNIGDTPYAAVLLSDGSIQAVNTDTGAQLQILPPGTILVPRTQMGFSQWGSQYLIFTKDQTNGYWLWDGTSTFGPGTFSPIVNVTNGGSNYTSPPNISVQTTGGGSGVTFSSTIDPGTNSVNLVTVTNPGSGFANGDFAIVNFSGGGSDSTAVATANLGSGGGVTGVVVQNPGHGFTAATSISLVGGGGSGATAAPNIQNGAIISVTILNPGSGYTSPPSPDFHDPGFAGQAGGTGFYGYTTIGANGIQSIGVNSGGSGYTSVPTVTIIGDGQGAAATAHVAGGVVTDVAVTNPGQGYTKALVQFSGGNNAAEATVGLMPFGISGTAAEVYQSRVWVVNGAAQASWPPKARLQWSDAETPADFGGTGGALVGSDSFLRVGWHNIKQANGYLYLIGDSSINVISGLNVPSVPASATGTTTLPTPVLNFQNQNTDPQIGSPWPSSVQLFFRNILMANSQGAFVLYGGAVRKESQPLDGIYGFDPSVLDRHGDFSSAVAQIFGIQVYMLLAPFLNPVTGATVTQLLMYDQQKWWTSEQGVQLTYVATQEINSVLTAWGTDGKTLFRLFQQPSTAFPKVLRSKLWPNPGYEYSKTAIRLWGIVQDFAWDQPMTISLEEDTGGATDDHTINPGPPGTDVLGPYPTGQQGKLIGIKLQTNCSAGKVVSFKLREQDFVLNQ